MKKRILILSIAALAVSVFTFVAQAQTTTQGPATKLVQPNGGTSYDGCPDDPCYPYC